jgi:hypothetical protein
LKGEKSYGELVSKETLWSTPHLPIENCATTKKCWRVRLDYSSEKAIMGMGKLCSMTRARGIYMTCRTATERENLRIWARDSLVMREGALRCGECERCGAHYGLHTRVVMSVDMRKIQPYIWYFWSLTIVTVTLFFLTLTLLFHFAMFPFHFTSFSLASLIPHASLISDSYWLTFPWTFPFCTSTLGPCSISLPI